MIISILKLKAANACASNEKNRDYLNGVHVECTATHIIYVATDGHRLIAINSEYKPDNTDRLQAGVIIPTGFIAKIKVNKHTSGDADLTVDNGLVIISYDRDTFYTKPIDGTFPNWRRVLPTACTGETAQFNPEYLTSFVKAAKAMYGGPRPIALSHNGEGAALVRIGAETDAVGVLMPIKTSAPLTCVPDWATTTNATED